MAVTTGTQPRSAGPGANSDREPYFRRLEPIDGGYNLAHENGRPIGRVRVYDDRADEQAIHVQIMQGQAYGAKVAVMHFDTIEEYDDLIDVLSRARVAMARTAKKP